MNYEKDLKIDETALDVEWVDQPVISFKYGKHWAYCKKVAAQAEDNVKVIRAELIALANSNPVKFCKKDKPNAADIEAFYRNHPRHKAAKQEWMDAEYELNMADVAKNEFNFNRKAALENLVILHGQEYFAGPSVPRNLTNEIDKKNRDKKVNSGISAGLNRRRTV